MTQTTRGPAPTDKFHRLYLSVCALHGLEPVGEDGDPVPAPVGATKAKAAPAPAKAAPKPKAKAAGAAAVPARAAKAAPEGKGNEGAPRANRKFISIAEATPLVLVELLKGPQSRRTLKGAVGPKGYPHEANWTALMRSMEEADLVVISETRLEGDPTRTWELTAAGKAAARKAAR